MKIFMFLAYSHIGWEVPPQFCLTATGFPAQIFLKLTLPPGVLTSLLAYTSAPLPMEENLYRKIWCSGKNTLRPQTHILAGDKIAFWCCMPRISISAKDFAGSAALRFVLQEPSVINYLTASGKFSQNIPSWLRHHNQKRCFHKGTN